LKENASMVIKTSAVEPESKYMFVFTERHVAREYLQAPASWCDKTQSSL
jgi:hypothetical protein